MTAVAPRPPRVDPSVAWRASGPWGRGLVAALGLLALVAVSVHVRTRAVSAGLWIDEGISVGIAAHPLAAIPAVLRQDGSPPLYYGLLHEWMAVAGRSELATHLLSVVAAVATVPVAWWLGRTLWDVRAAWTCAALFALNPLLTLYAQETRMYALVALLSLLAAGAFVACFVQGRRRFAWLHAAALAALLYTHNWALFLLACEGVVATALVAARHRRRALIADSLIALAVPLALYAPWIPTLLFQRAHTGAPWSRTPHLRALQGAVDSLLGPPGPLLALAIVIVAAGLALRTSRWRRDWAVLALLAGGTLAIAWAYNQHSAGWSARYLCLLLGPLLLLTGLCAARAGTVGIVAIAAVAVIWFQQPPYWLVAEKSNTRLLAGRIERRLAPGDVVLDVQPESVPALRYYLGPRLRYVSPLGPVRDPGVMDWRDVLARLRATAMRSTVTQVHRLPPGTRVAFVRQPGSGRGGHSPWTRLVRHRGAILARRLEHDRRLQRLAYIGPGFHGARSTLAATIYLVRAGSVL